MPNTILEAGGTNTRGDANAIVDYLKSLPGNQVSDDLLAEIAARLVIWLDTGGEGTLTSRVAEAEKDIALEVANRTNADAAISEEVSSVDEALAALAVVVDSHTSTLTTYLNTLNDHEARIAALEP